MDDQWRTQADLSLRRWHYLAVLAEEMHFTRAAERLYVSQPALSQQIRTLERDLGVSLLARNGPRFELTPAGVAAAEQAVELLVHLHDAQRRVQAAARGESGCLKVAYTRSYAGPEPAEILAAYRSRYPDVGIELETGWTTRNVDEVETGRIDVAFVRLPVLAHPLVATTPIVNEEILIAHSSVHPLQGREKLTRGQLRGASVIFWPRDLAPGHYDEISRQIWPTGEFTVVREEPDDDQLMRAVAAGFGIAAVPEHRARQLATRAVTFRRLVEPVPRIGLGIAHPARRRTTLVEHFLDVASAHLGVREHSS